MIKNISFSSKLKTTHLQLTRKTETTLLLSGILTEGKQLKDFMQANQLAGKDETVLDVLIRATKFLADTGKKFYGEKQSKLWERSFLEHVSDFRIILGSPILTNAGRRKDKSVSACSIPPVNLSKMSHEEISEIVSSYHSKGMGTGFCLDDLEDPVEMIKHLNHLAISEVQEGKIERSVGNMGVLSVHHPKVLDFIKVKTANPEIKEWKFNLSVNITDSFMSSLSTGAPFILNNGSSIAPEILIHQIAADAHSTGDPGLIFMDRINHLNRAPQMGKYKTVVPCGEVSLFEGEVCQFIYLNLFRFVKEDKIDKDALRKAVHTGITLLDNALESNINRVPNSQSSEIISNLRRVGIGVCGFSEVLHALGLPYSSKEGRDLASSIMSFINFESKKSSILSKRTWSIPPFF